jgi:hypothetical protein
MKAGSTRRSRARKPKKTTCTMRHEIRIEISQEHARCVAQGGFLPRAVADQLIASIEALYQKTAARESIAKLGGVL